jgi:hypothetical protein
MVSSQEPFGWCVSSTEPFLQFILSPLSIGHLKRMPAGIQLGAAFRVTNTRYRYRAVVSLPSDIISNRMNVHRLLFFLNYSEK